MSEAIPKMIHFGISDKEKIESVDQATRRNIDVRKGIFKYQQPMIEHYHYDNSGNIQNSFKRPRRELGVKVFMKNATRDLRLQVKK